MTTTKIIQKPKKGMCELPEIAASCGKLREIAAFAQAE